jgi:U3 small nucleolar RNA-associated protein 23
MEALYKLGKEHQAITDMAKNFERRRCNHRTAIEEEECIKDVVGESALGFALPEPVLTAHLLGPTNKHRYTMAVQSGKLRQHLRNIPGVPVIHFNERGVMVMEMPSDATLKQKDTVSLHLSVDGHRAEICAFASSRMRN